MKFKNHIVWGQHNEHGPLFIKLASYESQKQIKRRKNEGWRLVICQAGTCPQFDAIGNLISNLA